MAAFYLGTSNNFRAMPGVQPSLETFYGNAGDTPVRATALGWYPVGNFATPPRLYLRHFTYSQIKSLIFPTAASDDLLPNARSTRLTSTEVPPHRSLGAWICREMQAGTVDPPACLTRAATLVHARVRVPLAGSRQDKGESCFRCEMPSTSGTSLHRTGPRQLTTSPARDGKFFLGIHFWFGHK